MSTEPRVVKRVAPIFIKPLSPEKDQKQSPSSVKESPKNVKKIPSSSKKVKSSKKVDTPKKPSSKKNLFGDGKTKGQNREYKALMRSKVLGPLLLQDELQPIKRDPLKPKPVTTTKKSNRKCEKKNKVFCAKIYIGQGGRRYIKHGSEKIYLDKRK
jgi:hypothetical protein